MDLLAYWLYRSAGALLGRLPLHLVYALGRGAGFLAYLLAGSYRLLAQRNVAIAFGKELTGPERRRLVREHFTTLGGNLLANLRIARLSPEQLRAAVEIEGLELVQQLIAEKRGIVPVISHLGNWELLSQIWPVLFSCPLGSIYQRLGNPYMDAEVRASRARLGLQLFERKEGFAAALQVLRAGGAVGVLVDQHAGDAGVWVPFFGRLASTSSLAAMLALRTGAALLPTAIYTEGRGRWKMVIRPPIAPIARDTDLTTAAINRALEQQIRFRPADWFWVHNRWKTPQPKFLLSTYKRGVVIPPDEPPLQHFRLAIRSSNWLGDAVMSAPAVRAIKQGRPDLYLAVLTPAKLADFWHTLPEVDEVIAILTDEGPWAVARRLRGQFEAIVLFPNSVRVALEAWLAGVPRIVGYPGHRRRWLLDQVWRDKKKEPEPPRHQVHHYLQLAKFIGAKIPTALTLEPRSVVTARPRVGLCPGAEYGGAKRWLPVRFQEVMSRFAAEDGGEWTLFGVAKDAPLAEEILTGFTGPVRNRIGATTLEELIAELSGCDALVTNDTGTMHLAAALGVPVVAIFGSTEPRLTGPLGTGHRALRHHVECSPCFLRECPRDLRCMKSVEVEEVLTALREVLSRRTHLRHARSWAEPSAQPLYNRKTESTGAETSSVT